MKITIEIDCTPDEARRALGLPDLAPMQEAVMAEIQRRTLDALAATSPEALMRPWLPFSPFSPEQMQQAMAGFLKPAFGPKRAPKQDGGR